MGEISVGWLIGFVQYISKVSTQPLKPTLDSYPKGTGGSLTQGKEDAA
jgi:hypothetical protein